MQRRGAVDGGGARQPVDVECACFGKARCTTCHVYVPSGILSSLPDPTEAELDALDTERTTPAWPAASSWLTKWLTRPFTCLPTTNRNGSASHLATMQRRGAVNGGGARQQVDVECACFGKARCTTCHVYVPSGILSSLPDPTEAELDALDTERTTPAWPAASSWLTKWLTRPTGMVTPAILRRCRRGAVDGEAFPVPS
ncbi:hypothetical protein DIPPA_12385 [Diplonema papillatum]|nr:hypothetical protein DIPPA_12385 [Diplonema papillatum]